MTAAGPRYDNGCSTTQTSRLLVEKREATRETANGKISIFICISVLAATFPAERPCQRGTDPTLKPTGRPGRTALYGLELEYKVNPCLGDLLLVQLSTRVAVINSRCRVDPVGKRDKRLGLYACDVGKSTQSPTGQESVPRWYTVRLSQGFGGWRESYRCGPGMGTRTFAPD